jgi:hypothetical protein
VTGIEKKWPVDDRMNVSAKTLSVMQRSTVGATKLSEDRIIRQH